MTHEERVLDAFEPGIWLLQSDIPKVLRMDPSTCLHALKTLVAEGVLEFAFVERSGIRGRRRHIYRLAMRKTVAA